MPFATARRAALAAGVASPCAVVIALSGADAATNTVQVGANGNTFSPSTLTVQAGDTVTWMMAEGGHDVDGQGFGTALVKQPAGSTYSHVFTTPGTFNYVCDFHGGMSGKVIVQAIPVTPPTPGTTPLDPLAPVTEPSAGPTATIPVVAPKSPAHKKKKKRPKAFCKPRKRHAKVKR